MQIETSHPLSLIRSHLARGIGHPKASYYLLGACGPLREITKLQSELLLWKSRREKLWLGVRVAWGRAERNHQVGGTLLASLMESSDMASTCVGPAG